MSCYALMLCAVWVYPGFTECAEGSIWCSIIYWSTQSAGRPGTLIIIILTSVGFALTGNTALDKLKVMLRTFVVLSIFLAGFAWLNDNVLKPAFHISRPSHLYIIKQAHSTLRLDSIYTLVVTKRRTIFNEIISSDTIHFKSVDRRILNHWVEEAGYSFPSGHSFNAFLLGTFIAWCIFELKGRKIGVLPFLPLLWASIVGLSRVAIGAHTPLDVTAGAGLGLVLSHALLAIPAVRKLIVPVARDMHPVNVP